MKNSEKRVAYRGNPMPESKLRDLVLALVYDLSVLPAMIPKVFLRRNFGERTFSFEACVNIFILLMMPVVIMLFLPRGVVPVQIWLFVIPWVAFDCLFIWVAWQHRKGKQKYSSSINFNTYSRYEGDEWEFWWKLDKILDRPNLKVDFIIIEKYLEPLIVVLAGILLLLLIITIPVGCLLIVSGIFLFLQRQISYFYGKQTLLDINDQRIQNEQLHSVLVDQKPARETAGYQIKGIRAPKDIREKWYKVIKEEQQGKTNA